MGASSSTNFGDRSKSPTNNLDAHKDSIITKEVDLSYYPGSQGTEIEARINPKHILLEAAKRDSELSSDGRRTVNNIINQTSSALSMLTTGKTKSPEHKTFMDIQDLSNTVSFWLFLESRSLFSTNNSVGLSSVRTVVREESEGVPQKRPLESLSE